MLCGITLLALSSQQTLYPSVSAVLSADVPLLDGPHEWLIGPVVFGIWLLPPGSMFLGPSMLLG